MIKLKKFILIAICCLFCGWGSVGHKIINRYATLSFPTELNFLLSWADSLANHGSDADNRKSCRCQKEDVKHYIDIDNYPDFKSDGRITHNFDSLVMKYGYSYVMDQGILPWAILQIVDPLTASFRSITGKKQCLQLLILVITLEIAICLYISQEIITVNTLINMESIHDMKVP